MIFYEKDTKKSAIPFSFIFTITIFKVQGFINAIRIFFESEYFTIH